MVGLLCGAVLFGCTKSDNDNTFVPGQEVKNPNPPSTTTPTDGPFVHPGILNTGASLDFIASDFSPVRTAAFQKVTDYIASHAYPTSFYETVAVGSNGHTSPSKSQIRSDAELAYAYALKFARTADIADAEKCIGILNGWASTFKTYTTIDATDNANQPSLEAAWTTPTFVAAAEIMRYYKPKGKSANWSEEDIQQFSNYLSRVKPYLDKMPDYHNNWNVSGGYALMTIGIFQDNTSIYGQGVGVLTKVATESDNHTILEDGTMPEACDRNDCVHYQYSLTGLTYGAELAAINGDNSLYKTFRVSLGYDFMRKAYDRTAGCSVCSASSPMFPGLEVALQHFGTSLASVKSLKDQMSSPMYVPSDNTFLGFTTYTHYNVTK